MTALKRFWDENWLTILVVGVLAVAYLLLRSTPSDIASVQAFTAELQQGRPTVAYFYSNT